MDKPYFIELILTDPTDPDKVHSVERININRFASRKFFIDRMWWALHNNLAVHSAAVNSQRGI